MKTLFLFLLGAAAAAAAPDDTLFRAMRDEMARSMKKLQLEKLEKPYYISYKIVDTDAREAAATFGAITEASDAKRRLVAVEVRVGDYARDNTNFFTMRFNVAGVERIVIEGGVTTPLDDNYDEIRRKLWTATDSAYKQALDDYAKKKAVLENRNRTDDSADFSKEPPQDNVETAAPADLTAAEAAALAKKLSALFRASPAIDNSAVRITNVTTTTRFLDSEGGTYLRVKPLITLSVAADTQAPDGMPIADADTIYARAEAELPAEAALLERVRSFQARLTALRSAPLVERYTGPVLFEGQAAAELVGQTLAPSLAALPRLVVEDSRFERMFDAEGGGLRDKLGSRILPAHVTLLDDASRPEYRGAKLFGGYQVDEEGVPARENRLVERGVLKSLLTSRSLTNGFTRSSGNRRTAGTLPSNLILASDKGVPIAELKKKLIEMAKERGNEYGILVRKIGNPTAPRPQGNQRRMVITISSHGGGAAGSGAPVEPVIEAYKVYPDGREELIRNLGLVGMGLASFRDITAVSDAPVVHTAAYRNTRQSPLLRGQLFLDTPLVSIGVPALLFEELTLQRPSGEVPKLPFTRHPSFASQ